MGLRPSQWYGILLTYLPEQTINRWFDCLSDVHERLTVLLERIWAKVKIVITLSFPCKKERKFLNFFKMFVVLTRRYEQQIRTHVGGGHV